MEDTIILLVGIIGLMMDIPLIVRLGKCTIFIPKISVPLGPVQGFYAYGI